MLKGHLQAWTWQDEWNGLTMEVCDKMNNIADIPKISNYRYSFTMVHTIEPYFLQDIREIERKTAADLKRRMQILNGEIPDDADGSDIEDDGESGLQSEVDAPSKSAAKSSEIGETSDSMALSAKSSEQKCHQEARETFNSIEYAEAEIPNIIPKPSDRLPRKSSVGLGLGTSAAMKRSRSGGLNAEKSSLDQYEGKQKWAFLKNWTSLKAVRVCTLFFY